MSRTVPQPTPPKMRSVVALAEGFTPTDRLDTSHWLAFKDDFQVYVALADGRERRSVFSERKRSTACPLAWSRDGRTLYEVHDQIYAVDVATGDAPAITAFSTDTGVAGDRIRGALSDVFDADAAVGHRPDHGT